jgi:hypothetical protein
MIRNPQRHNYFMYSLLSDKLQTRVKRSLHTNRVILQLRQRADPNKLFVPKEIRTLNLMKLPQRLKLLSLEPTP